MNRSRIPMWLLHLVILSLAALGWGQSRKVHSINDHVGLTTDWRSSRIVVSGGLTQENLKLAELDPRIRFNFARRFQSPGNQMRQIPSTDGYVWAGNTTPTPQTVVDGMSLTNDVSANRRIDWSVPLGNGIVAPNEYPAKYQYNPGAPPDCVNDYVVFALNVAGVTNGQANVLGINNLYSGPSGSPPCGAKPKVYWAYNGSTANGMVLTSPVPSEDGTKIAYIESTGSSSVFHVLTWKAGEGTSATTAAAPILAGTGNCTASTSCLTSVTFSTTSTDTLTSVWVDFSTDKAFVASDDGTIYRISCAFHCHLDANPTIDWNFALPVRGTGGSIAQPTQVLYDDWNGYLLVADELGEVWTINAGGSTPSVAFGPVMVGGGGCDAMNPPGRTGTQNPCTANGTSFGVNQSIILDITTGMVYAFSGNDGTPGASAAVVQMPLTLSPQIRVHVGLGFVGSSSTNVDLHAGAFDNTYWGNTPSAGHLILCGTGTNDTTPWQYWIGFSAYPVMDSTNTKGIQQFATTIPCTDYTEFYNPNIALKDKVNDHDLLAKGLIGPTTSGNIETDDVSFFAWPYPEPITFVNYPGGVSNIVVDNDGSQPEESSLYFSTLGVVTVGTCYNARCAVKLTQLNLQ